MSIAHLDALKHALDRRGWRIVNVHPGDESRISATWEIQRSGSEPVLILDFEGVSADGDCLPLDESYACNVRGHESTSLYFRRINRKREIWERELAAFVLALDDQCPV